MGTRIVILHTNDFHGRLTPEKAQAIHALKVRDDALFFDGGDCIKTGNLGVPLAPESAWPLLAAAGCDASVLGNRETHVLPAAFRSKLAGVAHPLVCANLRPKKGDSPVLDSVMLEHAGVRVGVTGAMVPMVTERMATRSASAYLWDTPVETLRKVIERLRPEVDLLIALTHVGHKQDRLIAETCHGIDLILGAHSHTVIDPPERIGSTWICQGGSHGRLVGRYVWEVGDGLVEAELLSLDDMVRAQNA